MHTHQQHRITTYMENQPTTPAEAAFNKLAEELASKSFTVDYTVVSTAKVEASPEELRVFVQGDNAEALQTLGYEELRDRFLEHLIVQDEFPYDERGPATLVAVEGEPVAYAMVVPVPPAGVPLVCTIEGPQGRRHGHYTYHPQLNLPWRACHDTEEYLPETDTVVAWQLVVTQDDIPNSDYMHVDTSGTKYVIMHLDSVTDEVGEEGGYCYADGHAVWHSKGDGLVLLFTTTLAGSLCVSTEWPEGWDAAKCGAEAIAWAKNHDVFSDNAKLNNDMAYICVKGEEGTL